MPARNPDFEGKKMKKKMDRPKTDGRSAPRTRKKPFRLEVGREYEDRRGVRSGKLTRTPDISDNSHPFHSSKLMRTYRPDGGWWFHGESANDLIREVPSAKPFRMVVTKVGKTPKSSPYAETHPHMTEMRVEMTGAKRPRSRKAKGSHA